MFRYILGITKKQFDDLLPKFEQRLVLNSLKTYATRSKMLRERGGGRKSKLINPTQKLIMILFYYKHYPTLKLCESIFKLDHTNVSRWLKFLELALSESVEGELELKITKVRMKTIDCLIEVCPELKNCITDCTERPVRRPKNNVKQEQYYSGKKKDHTVKNQIYLNPTSKRITAISKQFEGKKHDSAIFKEDKMYLKAPPNSQFMGDTAYIGLTDESPYIQFITPVKKPVGKELTDTQKGINKTISSVRVQVEHPFAYMKHFNILRHDYRGKNIEHAHVPFKTIACIYNMTRTT